MCGFSWEYSEMECSSCETGGRDSLGIYAYGGVLYYKCWKCGHTLGVAKAGSAVRGSRWP